MFKRQQHLLFCHRKFAFYYFTKLKQISSKQAKRKSKHNHLSKGTRSSSLGPHHNLNSSDRLVLSVPIKGTQTNSKLSISIKVKMDARRGTVYTRTQRRRMKALTSKSLKNKCVSAKLKIISSIRSPSDTDVGGS